MTQPAFCTSIADLAPHYAGFIVDQWGVLHDGARPYPGAIECLRALRAADRRVVLLSNVADTVATNLQRLRAMGFGDDLFDALVTAGEAMRRALASPPDPFFAALGDRCLLWTRKGDRAIVEGLRLALVDNIDEATFILLAGIDDDATLERFEPALRAALARRLPMVCANPDVLVVGPRGVKMAPGAIAQHYQAMGGRVAFTGKPHRPIYQVCLEALAPLQAEHILAVGDSFEHDVAGGAGAGLDTALIMGGIHADAFDLDGGADGNRATLAHLAEVYRAMPRFVLPRFRW